MPPVEVSQEICESKLSYLSMYVCGDLLYFCDECEDNESIIEQGEGLIEDELTDDNKIDMEEWITDEDDGDEHISGEDKDIENELQGRSWSNEK